MKHTALAFAITALLAGCNTSSNDSQAPSAAEQAYEYLVQLSSTAEGIGARPTGSEAETRAAAWIQDHLAGWGYEVQRQPFTYTQSGTSKASQNLVAELKGKSDKVILIGAHYDSTGDKQGSEGGHRQRCRGRSPLGGRRSAQGADPALHGALRLLWRRGEQPQRLQGLCRQPRQRRRCQAAGHGELRHHRRGATLSTFTRPTPTWPSTSVPTRAATASIPRCGIAC